LGSQNGLQPQQVFDYVHGSPGAVLHDASPRTTVLSQTATSITPDAVIKQDGAWCRVRRRPQVSTANVSMPWQANPLTSRASSPPSLPPAGRSVAHGGVRIAGSHGDGSQRFVAKDSSREKFNGALGSLRYPVSLSRWRCRLHGSSGRWAARSDEIGPGQSTPPRVSS
jgi:hypothetical protein